MADSYMQKKDDTPESSTTQGILEQLVGVVQKSLSRANPLQAFVIAMGALIVILVLGLAFATPYLSNRLQIDSNIAYTALTIIFFLAVISILATLIASDGEHGQLLGGKSMGQEQGQEKYRFLRKCLDDLNEIQFQEMVNNLLDPKRQDELSQPHTKSSFLSDMQRWGHLYEVEVYLRNKLPKHFEE
jgi:hypothetical protein